MILGSRLFTKVNRTLSKMNFPGTMEFLVRELESGMMIRDKKVKNVMLQVDRRDFCPVEPYFDAPQPIGHNATISAPHMHAWALSHSIPHIKEDSRILDVGSGSGYLTVCYSLLAPKGKVVGIEHIPNLVEASKRNVKKNHPDLIESGRITLVEGDGRLGYPSMAPFDVIHVGAAAESTPNRLLEQLANGGILIIPVGGWEQTMNLYKKDKDGVITLQETLPVRYVPLTDPTTQLG